MYHLDTKEERQRSKILKSKLMMQSINKLLYKKMITTSNNQIININ